MHVGYTVCRVRGTLITQWCLFKHIPKVDVLVAIPGLGTYINIAIAVNIGCLGFVAAFAGENQMLFERLAFAVEIFPYKPFMGRLTG